MEHKPKKVGGSAGLAALIKQRTEIVQQAQLSGQEVNLPPMIVASNSSTATLGSSSTSPVAKSTYLPKTTSFSSSNKCYMCDKTVYKPEELIAIGQIWHDKCFTCGGKNSDGCGRVMKRDGYLDHNSQPYCNACYNKLFRTKGFGYGNSLNTDFVDPLASKSNDSTSKLGSKSNDSVGKLGSKSTDSVNSGSGAVNPTPAPLLTSRSFSAPPPPPAPPAARPPAPPAAPPAAPPSAPPAPPAAPPSAPSAPPAAPPAPRAAPPTPAPATAPAPVAPAAPAAPKYTPTNNVSVSSSTAPKCTSCSKTVYKMEEIVAVGRVWHNSCFQCGGTKGDGCRKTLTRDNYVDHENQPYCNPCYSKLFRPKGFGYGNTLNTDYGPAPEVVAASIVESQGTVSAEQSFQKPKAPGRPSQAPKAPSGAPPAPPATAGNPLIIPVTDGNEVSKGTIKIGGKAGDLYQEAAYAGDHDEVDESEW